MVDNLYTFDQIRAALPDNTSNLISPENVRSAILSTAADAGEIGGGTEFTMVLAAGVPANLNALAPSPDSEILRGWAVDGNNALIADFAAEGFTIAPGHMRGVQMTATIVGHKEANDASLYTFDLLKGAVIVATATWTVERFDVAGSQLFVVGGLEPYEPALQEPWSIQVTSDDGDNLVVSDWDLKSRGLPI